MPERRYQLGAHERDRIIVQMRAGGAPLSAIAARVGMSRGGVSRALAWLHGDDDDGEW
jgi:DNA-binding CsgD family transcriptional regulator